MELDLLTQHRVYVEGYLLRLPAAKSATSRYGEVMSALPAFRLISFADTILMSFMPP